MIVDLESVENVRKGENARNNKFFSKGLFLRIVKPGNFLIKSLVYTTQSRLLLTLNKKSLEKIVGKGENAGDQHFLLFPQCFLPSFPNLISLFHSLLFCHLQIL